MDYFYFYYFYCFYFYCFYFYFYYCFYNYQKMLLVVRVGTLSKSFSTAVVIFSIAPSSVQCVSRERESDWE